MKNILYFYTFLLIVSRVSGAGLRHTNVAIIIDVDEESYKVAKEFLQNTLNDISLLNYRVSLFTTNGVSQKLVEFQSRQCMVGKLRRNIRRFRRLTDVTQKVMQDLDGSFSNDSNIILILTDKEKSNWLIRELNHLAANSKNKRIYLKLIGDQQNNGSNPVQNSYHSSRYGYRDWQYHYSTKKKVKENKKINILTSAGHNLRKLDFLKGSSRSCIGHNKSNDRYVRDECNRRCECINGKLTNCFRVRQEFSSMTKTERLRFINVYKYFSTSKRFQVLYSNYVNYHFRYFYKGLHKPLQFFPWHRKYVLGFENYLRLFDCRVTIPFWNWALHHKHAWKVTPNYHIWRVEGGLGGNGLESKRYCVKNGTFANHRWKPANYEKTSVILRLICESIKKIPASLKDFCKHPTVTMENKNCLRRRFNGNTPSYRFLYETITKLGIGKFKRFEHIVRMHWHSRIHNAVGGHMETDYSSSSPEFWLHHSMLDCTWEKWQNKGHVFKHNFYQNKHIKLMAFQPSEYRYKYVQNNNLAGCGIKVTCDNVLPYSLKTYNSLPYG